MAEAAEVPSALPTAFAMQTIADLADIYVPQGRVLIPVLEHLEDVIYSSHVEEGDRCAVTREQYNLLSMSAAVHGILPPQYAGRTPYFALAKTCKAELAKLQEQFDYLARLKNRSEQLSIIQQGLAATLWSKGLVALHSNVTNKGAAPQYGHRSACPTATTIARDAINTAVRVFALGVWKFFHEHMRRRKTKKNDIMQQGMVNDLLSPFKHWQMYMVECRVEAHRATRQAFGLEGNVLAVQAEDLERQQEDLFAELVMSQGTHRRLQKRFDTERDQRVHLEQKFEKAKPALLKKTLTNLLNLTFMGTLREAQLSRIPARKNLAAKEFTVLLAYEEEHVARLTSLPIESVLMRWLNYHIIHYKYIATQVLEARRDDDGPTRKQQLDDHDGGGGPTNEWSARDAELYRERCRLVRGLQRVSNMSEDLRDGSALCVLYAAMACGFDAGVRPAANPRRGSDHPAAEAGGGTSVGGGPNPAALWLLDDRDADSRVARLCDALNMMLPRGARWLLRPADISKGHVAVLIPILATFFLHSSRLPSALPEAKIFDFVGLYTQDDAFSVTMNPQRSLSASAFVPAGEATIGAEDAEASPTSPTSVSREAALFALARQMLRDKDGDKTQGFAGDDARQAAVLAPTKHIMLLMEKTAVASAYDPMHDFTFLLTPGEVPSDLLKLKAHQLLLRWVNFHLKRNGVKAPVESYADFKGGIHLFRLLLEVAPDVVALHPLAKGVGTTPGEDAATNVVVDSGPRVASFEVLNVEAIRDGQVDLLAAFVAGVFMARPTMVADEHSLLRVHLDTIVTVVKCGDPSEGKTFPEMCMWLKTQGSKYLEAAETVRAAQDLQEKICESVACFQADLLTQRAIGCPCFDFEVAQGGRDHESQPHYHVVQPARLEALLTQSGHMAPAKVTKKREALDDICRKTLPLFREMFQYYGVHRALAGERQNERRNSNGGGRPGSARPGSATPRTSHRRSMGAASPTNGAGANNRAGRDAMAAASAARRRSSVGGLRTKTKDTDAHLVYVDLRGFTRIGKDCRLRTMRLTPVDIEAIYNETMESYIKEHTVEEGLLPEGASLGLTFEPFVEALVTLARDARPPEGHRNGRKHWDLPQRFTRLVESHFWPHATRRNDDMFYQFAYDAGMAVVVAKYDHLLRAVFRAYANFSSQAAEWMLFRARPKSGLAATACSRLGSNASVEPLHLSPSPDDVRIDSLMMPPAMLGVDDGDGSRHSHSGFNTPSPCPSVMSPEKQRLPVLDLAAVEAMLEHAGLLGGTLSPAALQSIWRGVQKASSADDISDEQDAEVSGDSDEDDKSSYKSGKVGSDGSGHDSWQSCATEDLVGRIAYQEFIDIMVAVVIYRDPNPFMPFSHRFEAFLAAHLLYPLAAHWSRIHDSSLGAFLSKGLAEVKQQRRSSATKSRRVST